MSEIARERLYCITISAFKTTDLITKVETVQKAVCIDPLEFAILTIEETEKLIKDLKEALATVKGIDENPNLG